MSYTPPSHNAVDFSGPAGLATPPAADAVNFPPPAPYPTYSASMALAVAVVPAYRAALPVVVAVSDARVFETSVGAVTWSLVAAVAGVDVSAQLTGECVIEAAEDAARLATVALVPASAAQLAAFDSASITVDVVISGGGYSARRRRFTGVVESVEFEPAGRVATLTCRDGYQERVKACMTSAEVKALCGGLAVVSDQLLRWDDAEPDAWSYFQDALATVPGATYIDGAGAWRVAQWDIGAPARTYTEDDVFDPGPLLRTQSRADVPAAIVASLNHTFPRLHNVALGLYWQGLPGLEYTTRGINAPTQEMITAALEGLADWHIAGEPVFVNFDPVAWPVGLEMSAVLYRRWYQMVERRYTVTIDMGGASDRDESIARALSSDFDVGEWESGRSSQTALGIYSANAPYGTPPDDEPTGYEALTEPWPPTNSAIDWPAIESAEIQDALAQVVAEATRTAAQGRRRQRVEFSRPADLRLDIGVVVGIDAHGLTAVGQLQSWTETYSHEAGSCVGEYFIACPAGDGGVVTASAVTATIPAPSVTHALVAPDLRNHVGASTDTYPYFVPPETISGHLANVNFAAAEYDASAPAYIEQFRIVMPEIAADLRDPVEETVEIEAEIHIAGSGVVVTFD